LGIRAAGECIKFQPNQPTQIIVIPRHTQTGIKILETQAGFVFHHANAFEVDNEIVIDSICYETLPEVEPKSDFRQVNFEAISPGQLWRFHVNLDNGNLCSQIIESRCCEFPSINTELVGRD
jgi:all-trans-8'-apo-beta-carotenal 15,15'-oxygenase